MEAVCMLLLMANGLRMVASSGSVNTSTVFRFSPQSGNIIIVDDIQIVTVTAKTSVSNFTEISFRIKDVEVAKIVGNSSVLVQPIDCAVLNHTWIDDVTLIQPGGYCFNFSFGVQGTFLGRSDMEFYADVFTEGSNLVPIRYEVVVVRNDQTLRDVFRFTLLPLICLNMMGFGCALELTEVWKIMKKPIAPAIGMGCQFILNPLVSYGLGKAMDLGFALGLGLFALGCSPGGGLSNLWSYLLDGDVNLSILMTFVSTVVSFATLPFWMYTLGKTLVPENVTVPFDKLFITLISFVLPCVIGLLINRFAPKAAAVIRKLIKVIALIILLYAVPLGIYVNLYMFTLMKNWRVMLCACLFPYTGYIVSAVIAWIARQPKPRILTISIETAIQNIGVATVLILTAFPQPEADIGAVMPIVVCIFIPVPLMVIFGVKKIRERWCKSDKTGDGTSSTASSTKQLKPEENGSVKSQQQIVGVNYKQLDKSGGVI